MPQRIFLAGASGAIGRRLTPLMVGNGCIVLGATRSSAKTDLIRSFGAEPVLVDVLHPAALRDAILVAKPDVIVHQLTDLEGVGDPGRRADAISRNARLRTLGTRNLMAAARAAGVRRVVAQSIAWAYALGPARHVETDPLDEEAPPPRAVTVAGVAALEAAVLGAAGVHGSVLRYGQLYGPGTGVDSPTGSLPLHVDAAAYAALLCLDRGEPGAYNIAEPNAEVSSEKAERLLGWRHDFRLP